jgi:CheY-like chemotaxis protein
MNLKVLIIDDEEIFLMLHSTWVEKCGMSAEPESFLECEEALTYLRNNHMNTRKFLLLLDVNMPVMNGWDLMTHIRNSEFADKVLAVIVTSSMDKDDIEKSKQFPFVIDYLEKPLTLAKCQNIKAKPELAEFVPKA